MRNKNGQFTSGYSGNAGGRPRDEHKVAELARSYAHEAVETLVELMRHSKDERVRGTAAQALLDRGLGKPRVAVVTEETGSFISALMAVNDRLDGKERSLENSSEQVNKR